MRAPIDHQEKENKHAVMTTFGKVSSAKELYNSIVDELDYSNTDEEDREYYTEEVLSRVKSMSDPDYYLDYVDSEEELADYVDAYNGMLWDLNNYVGKYTDVDVEEFSMDKEEALEKYREVESNG